jgi:hypothetical protein
MQVHMLLNNFLYSYFCLNNSVSGLIYIAVFCMYLSESSSVRRALVFFYFTFLIQLYSRQKYWQ